MLTISANILSASCLPRHFRPLATLRGVHYDLILQVRRWRPREGKLLAQGHTARNATAWD